jgi:hypothetical protein
MNAALLSSHGLPGSAALTGQPELLRLLPLLIVALLLIRRTRKPRTIRPGRLWLSPALLLVAGVIYAVGAVRLGPHVDDTGTLIIAAAAAAGVLVGTLRAQLLRLHRDPDTGAIQATFTMWGVLLLVAWMAGRDLLRDSSIAGATTPFSLFSDVAFALAIGAVVAQAVILTRRCRALAEDSAMPMHGESPPAE